MNNAQSISRRCVFEREHAILGTLPKSHCCRQRALIRIVCREHHHSVPVLTAILSNFSQPRTLSARDIFMRVYVIARRRHRRPFQSNFLRQRVREHCAGTQLELYIHKAQMSTMNLTQDRHREHTFAEQRHGIGAALVSILVLSDDVEHTLLLGRRLLRTAAVCRYVRLIIELRVAVSDTDTDMVAKSKTNVVCKKVFFKIKSMSSRGGTSATKSWTESVCISVRAHKHASWSSAQLHQVRSISSVSRTQC